MKKSIRRELNKIRFRETTKNLGNEIFSTINAAIILFTWLFGTVASFLERKYVCVEFILCVVAVCFIFIIWNYIVYKDKTCDVFIIDHNPTQIEVEKDGDFIKKKDIDLVVGDIVKISGNYTMNADILIREVSPDLNYSIDERSIGNIGTSNKSGGINLVDLGIKDSDLDYVLYSGTRIYINSGYIIGYVKNIAKETIYYKKFN
jgi:magnesium-transporting ATPase (P-type)